LLHVVRAVAAVAVVLSWPCKQPTNSQRTLTSSQQQQRCVKPQLGLHHAVAARALAQHFQCNYRCRQGTTQCLHVCLAPCLQQVIRCDQPQLPCVQAIIVQRA
jgi:hypothetical protein